MARLTSGRGLALAVLLGGAPLAAQQPEEPAPIADNSFLIEEAYNQESGVVQHISTFARPDAGGFWSYSFTQEWPLGGMKRQLSYTVPVTGAAENGTGVGDVALNFRYQVVGEGGDEVHVAPRLSLLVPSGDERRGRGAGGVGFQANLPVSVRPIPALALHANAGMTYTPRAKNPLGDIARTVDANLGGSAVWLVHPTFNLLLEALWLSTEEVLGDDRQVRSSAVFLNPGVRGAINFDSGLQIVPGLAYTVGLGDADGDDGLFLYLSFEHPFRH
ncbi:MAG TPA: transporter [Gemmatimonadales bacterium]|nr:transporter [Gemmatimonadales bacterium]